MGDKVGSLWIPTKAVLAYKDGELVEKLLLLWPMNVSEVPASLPAGPSNGERAAGETEAACCPVGGPRAEPQR